MLYKWIQKEITSKRQGRNTCESQVWKKYRRGHMLDHIDRDTRSWQERLNKGAYMEGAVGLHRVAHLRWHVLVLRLCSVSCLWIYKIRRTCKVPTRMNMWEVRNRFSGLAHTFPLKFAMHKLQEKGESEIYCRVQNMWHGHACQGLRIVFLCKFFLQWYTISFRHVYHFPTLCLIVK